jgi:hypothetical protein
MAHDAGLLNLHGEVCLSWALISFRKKDYTSSERMFRAALNIAERVAG